MLKQIVMNVLVGAAVTLVVMGPDMAVGLYMDAHAAVVQVLVSLV